jgi:NAD(P)H-flavin reductase/ferredoxin
VVKRAGNGFASDYILSNGAEGTKVTLTGPEGYLSYEPLRDAEHIIGIAGGSGIAPLYSLACAIADGTEDCSLTLLYGSRYAGDILLKDKLDAAAAKTGKVKVVYVLSDENVPGYEHGFIGQDLIKKYAPPEAYSIFICGPKAMYDYCHEQIKVFGLPPRRVRYETFSDNKTLISQPDYPGAKDRQFIMTVMSRDIKQEVPCAAGESLLVSLERSGLSPSSRCRAGGCAYCHAKLLAGEVFVPAAYDKRRLADVKHNYIHTCISFPLGDVTVEAPGQQPQKDE